MKWILTFILIMASSSAMAWDRTLYMSVIDDPDVAKSSDADCANIYQMQTPSENESDTTRDAAIFTCALVFCGKEKNVNREECLWFRQLSHQDDIRDYFQDLKDYIGLAALEKSKKKVVEYAESLNVLNKSMFFGIQNKINRQKLLQSYKNDDAILLKKSYLPDLELNGEEQFDLFHLKNFCSYIEAINEFCKIGVTSAPLDLMADSVLGEHQIVTLIQSQAAMSYIDSAITYRPLVLADSKQIYLRPIVSNPQKPVFTDFGYKHLQGKFLFTVIASMSQEILYELAAKRRPGVSSLNTVTSDNSNDNNLPLGIKDIFTKESLRRAIDPTWQSQMSSLSKGTVMKEMASMLSFQLVQNFEILTAVEKIEVLIGHDMALLLTFDKMPNEMQENPAEMSRRINESTEANFK